MAAKEIKSLTGIRGLAAIYVIIYHWYIEVPNGLQLSDSHWINTLLNSFIHHGYLSVDLFFVLSGFVLSLSSYRIFKDHISLNDYKSFMHKRFFRIFPLYICMTLVYFILFRKGGIIDLLVNLTLLQGLVPWYNTSIIRSAWSLTNEWVIYFFFPFMLYYLLKVRKTWILPLISLLLLLIISWVRSKYMNWWGFYQVKDIRGFYPMLSITRGPASFLRMIAAYFLGVFAFLLYMKNKEIRFLKPLSILLLALIFYDRSDILIVLLLPFFIIYLTRTNLISWFCSSKVIYFTGLISYSLYMNHFLFVNSYRQIPFLAKFNNNTLNFCYIMIGSVIVSVVTYYAIEKPVMDYIKRRRLKTVRTI